MTARVIFVIFFIISLNFLIAECFECGKRKASNPTGLIVGGNSSYPGRWPWFASLFLKKDDRFYCGSSLISDRHLLTGESMKINPVKKPF